MKTLNAIVLMLILAPTALCAGLYWESEMITTGAPGGDKTEMIKTFHAGYAVRIEQADSITIMDLKSGKIFSLDPKSKSYREISVEDMFKGGKDEQAAQEFVAKMMEDVKVEKTTETRKIGDFNCTKFIVTMMGVNSVYWMTDEVKEFSVLRDETLKYADKFKNNPMLQKSLSMAGGIEKLSGFMIEVTSEVSLGTKPIKTTNTVKKVEKKDFDAATFTVPADFTKMVAN